MSRSDKHASSGRQNDAPAGALSRRQLFPTLVGSVAIVGAALALGDSRMAAAQSKTSQQTAKYQDHPNNGSSCATCNFFRPPQSCQLVAGTISANGWCSFYAKKS